MPGAKNAMRSSAFIVQTSFSLRHYLSRLNGWRGNLIVVLSTLLLVFVLLLVFLLLPIALLALEFLLPKLVGGVFVEIGEYEGEYFVVPGHGTAF
jgi:hypothetical protein